LKIWNKIQGLSRTRKSPVGLNGHDLPIIINVTDGQTDRQTDDMQPQYRALHYSASRGKNSTHYCLSQESEA